MVLSDITVKWKFDYEMSPDEQTFHENYVDTFKFQMNTELNNLRLQFTYMICFDILYFPQLRKFFIEEISLNKDVLVTRLKDSSKLKSYFLWEYPELNNF